VEKNTQPSPDQLLTQMLQQVENLSVSVPHSLLDPRKDRDCRTVPAFYSRKPESIKIFDKSKGTITEVPVEQFEAEESITWSESPSVHSDRKRLILLDEDLRVKHLNLIYELLYFNSPKLAITHINDTVGKGVIAAQDFKQYDIIGLYSGLLDSRSVDADFKPYAYVCSEEQNSSSGFSTYYGTSLIDASQIRNHMSYIQHAPNEESLASLTLPDDVRKIVATSNVVVFTYNHLQWPILLLIVARDVKEGEQLFIDYGTYWKESQVHNCSDGSYALFDLDSEKIGTVNLEGSFHLNPDYTVKSTKTTIPVDVTALNIQISLHIKEVSLTKGKNNIGRYLRENVRRVLENARETHSNKHKKLFSSIEKCLSNDDPLKVYNAITHVMKRFNINSKKDIEITERELYLYLNTFIEDFKHLHESPKGQYQLNGLSQEEVEVRKSCINKITKRQWKFGNKRQIFHTSSENQAELASIRDVFKHHSIHSTQFGEDANKVCHLCYSAEDFCLENFLKLKEDEFKNLNNPLIDYGSSRLQLGVKS